MPIEKTTMTDLRQHLKDNYICDIAQQLDEDYANGDLTEGQIRRRVMESICAAVDLPVPVETHECEPVLSLSTIASLIEQVWKHKDADVHHAMVEANEVASKLRELSTGLHDTLGAVDTAGKLLDRVLCPKEQ
jgi:hypothetical protein